MRRPFNKSSWSHSLPRHRCFFGSCNTSVLATQRTLATVTAFWARDPNAFALPRIVKRSHRPVVIVYRTSSSCNFAFKQRVHVQICLSVFSCHVFLERSVVTLATPSVKTKPMTELTSAQTHRRNSNNWDFMILLNSHHTCAPLQRNRLEAAKFHDFTTS